MLSVSKKSLLILGLCAALVSVSKSDAAVISDSFQLNGTDREVGDPLVGTTTELGGVVWEGFGPSPAFATNGSLDYVTNAGPGDGGAFVSLASLSGNTSFSLTASFNSLGTQLMTIGYSLSVTSQFNNGQIWLFLDQSGSYSVIANGTSIIFNARAIPNWVAGGLNTVSLNYDATTNITTASFNGVADFIADLDNNGFVPTLNYAGFTFLNNGDSVYNEAQFANFSVEAVPEPSAIGLLALGGLGLICYIRSRRLQSV